MDGFSDHPFRKICCEMGAAFVVTEFINASNVSRNLNDLNRRIHFSEDQRPIGFQIYGNNLQEISSASEILQKFKPDFIDLNLGCAVRRVSGRGAGSGLLKEPEKLKYIVENLVKRLEVPVTAKMRLGWDAKEPVYKLISNLLEDCGVSLISVHGRYRNENWGDPADWEPIKEIKQSLSIPVIGNGDVSSLSKIEDIKRITGCDGVMIGRASFGNPWIFSRIEKSTLSQTNILDLIQSHWDLMKDFYGIEKADYLFRKHLKAYLDCPQFAHLDLSRMLRPENFLNDLSDLISI
jgi:nifR3 family TIM-barrel protein